MPKRQKGCCRWKARRRGGSWSGSGDPRRAWRLDGHFAYALNKWTSLLIHSTRFVGGINKNKRLIRNSYAYNKSRGLRGTRNRRREERRLLGLLLENRFFVLRNASIERSVSAGSGWGNAESEREIPERSQSPWHGETTLLESRKRAAAR
jgi:hypothetical protein